MEITVQRGSVSHAGEKTTCIACGYRFTAKKDGEELCVVCERLIRLNVATLEELQAEAAEKKN